VDAVQPHQGSPGAIRRLRKASSISRPRPGRSGTREIPLRAAGSSPRVICSRRRPGRPSQLSERRVLDEGDIERFDSFVDGDSRMRVEFARGSADIGEGPGEADASGRS
jgi:hypothetical protein